MSIRIQIQKKLAPTLWRLRSQSLWFRRFESILPRRNAGGRLNVYHLFRYQERDAIGPVQREEALLLHAITAVVRPKVVVEFGFFAGNSAFNFLMALDRDARLFSFDISDEAEGRAKRRLGSFRNFRFIRKSQADFHPDDVEGLPVDLVFIDAAHDLKINQATWKAILPQLSPDALVFIHDTGTWSRKHFTEMHEDIARSHSPAAWISAGELMHQPDERFFVNWILDNYPGFNAVHFHSKNCLRHGLTALQRTGRLQTEPTRGRT